MKIKKIEIKNFRLLKEVSLFFENGTTVIVGRNNSGKTSLTELFRRLLSEKSANFELEDFSLGVHEDFWNAFILKKNDAAADSVRAALPFIEAKITVEYGDLDTELGPLGEFIIDLDLATKIAVIVIQYRLEDGKIDSLFEGISYNAQGNFAEQKRALCKALKDLVPKLYRAVLTAVDPNDPTNEKSVEWSKFQALFRAQFINAQRGLDDETHREKEVLGKILSNLFTTAASANSADEDKLVADRLETAVSGIQDSIDRGFNDELKNLVPALTIFGYPGLSDPNLMTETTLDVQRLLTNNTKMRYAGANGINLPEAFNGLGTRNLIFILLKLLEFFKNYQANSAAPGIHLIFIEEPEAHLHPQMQEVFVRQLDEIARLFAQRFNNNIPWPVQFVLSTHSSHMANEAPFQAIRYFLAARNPAVHGLLETRVKDLRDGLSGKSKPDREFLHKYMTLTQCDLLFADKAILIEGTTERLLLPEMISKIDLNAAQKLASQYLTVMEVGGHHAQLFFDLLDFLELKTLVITDLDSVNHADHNKKCKVTDGTHTSNSCLKNWFNDPQISPAMLLSKNESEKKHKNLRLAYEIPETDGAACGRSFEDAFMLANPALFSISGNTPAERETDAWNKAASVDKTDFALEYAIEKPNWVVPRYIREGLTWLAQPPVVLTEQALAAPPAEAVLQGAA